MAVAFLLTSGLWVVQINIVSRRELHSAFLARCKRKPECTARLCHKHAT
jgi:hypothetical protein